MWLNIRCFQVQSVQVCLDNCKVSRFNFQLTTVISLFKYYKIREAFRVHKVSHEFKVFYISAKTSSLVADSLLVSVSWWVSIQFDSIWFKQIIFEGQFLNSLRHACAVFTFNRCDCLENCKLSLKKHLFHSLTAVTFVQLLVQNKGRSWNTLGIRSTW